MRSAGLAAIAAEDIPAVPAGFVSVPIEQRRGQIQFLAADLKAEALRAFEEVAARGDATIRKELGDNVADTSTMGALLAQIKENERALEVAVALVEYLSERGQYLESDALTILDDVADEVDHLAKKKPQIARSYPLTMALYEAKSRKIVEGRARAKSSKKAEPEG